ncbi:hypothetical protein [Streptomyces sp. NPDC058295]|uniref:hypothetical protein n=1 Tax=Streptomyces sp. NPDC058295 TaxID=3346431 RepID=UPI0036F02108
MTASKLKQDETTVRRTKLLKLRREGVRYDDQRILDLGYSDSGSARKDLVRALKAHRDEEAAEVGIYRQQENERLDALLEAAWPRATTPSPVFDKEGDIVDHALDMRAVDTVLRLMDRRAKLNGLDMPAKAELSGPGGGAVPIGPVGMTELRNLIRTAGEPDDDVDDPDDGEDTDDDGNHA